MTVTTPVYLDYNATTPCDPAVLAAMIPYFTDYFGNIDSRHLAGRRSNKALTEAKQQMAAIIGADPEELILTSGATESNNIALCGLFERDRKRNEILISALEHDSVVNAAKHLETFGFSIKIIPSTKAGFIDPNLVAAMTSNKTLLVSVMMANHEIGTLQPISEIASVAHASGALFHCDASQAMGKVAIDVRKMGADLLSFSGHKFYGPQGIGVLYVNARLSIKLSPILFGGGQQRGLRPGTIPLALAVGLGEACRLGSQRQPEDALSLCELTALMQKKLFEDLPGFQINGVPDLPGSINIRLPNISAEDLLLEVANDLCLSTGAACNSFTRAPSPVLKAIGLTDEQINRSIRISIGRMTTKEEILYAAERIVFHSKTFMPTWNNWK